VENTTMWPPPSAAVHADSMIGMKDWGAGRVGERRPPAFVAASSWA
jgi:hypothetical protein